MTFDQVVESCKGSALRPHRPAFRLEKDSTGWRVFDGNKDIALVMPYWMDIWSFSPFEPDIKANAGNESRVIDVHTVHNTWMNLGVQGWSQEFRSVGADALKWEWPKASGTELEGVATLSAADGQTARWTLHVRYDPAWGRYRYTWDIDVRKTRPTGMEAFNMLVTYALADRAEMRRWTHTVLPDGQDRPTRVPNSNALFLSHGYWAIRNTTFPRAWVAYLAHPQFNPVTIVHRTNVPITFHTCDQLFDQHVVWRDGSLDDLRDDGYFHFEMSIELGNMRHEAATKLLETSREPSRARVHGVGGRRVALPFRWDVVNSFEEEVDAWQPVECPIYILDAGADANPAWDQTVGRGDSRRSIRLSATSNSERRESFPIGAVFLVKPRHRYKLEAWVKTKDVDHFARLELGTCEYSYANMIDVATSADAAGTSDWTRLEVTLLNREQAYIMPKFVLYGPGTAWFDDVKLIKVK